MRYRIEYLTETTEVDFVCHVMHSARALDFVEAMARVDVENLTPRYGAMGFQIRDFADNGDIVALEDFRSPAMALLAGRRQQDSSLRRPARASTRRRAGCS